MQPLNFPAYSFRFKNRENTLRIFDVVRKKFVPLKPEEWVRQHVIMYLLRDKNYPLGLINVEKVIRVNRISQRYDLAVYRSDGSIALLVECKSPGTRITREVFDQLARYNLPVRAGFLMVTNGLRHLYCKMDFEAGKYEFLEDLPEYSG